MPMNNSMNTEMTQSVIKELEKGRAVWKTAKSVQTKVIKVDSWMRSMVRPAESEQISSYPPKFGP